MIDWTHCSEVESVPGRCGGAWVAKDSRVIVQSCILDHADDGFSAAWIAENFELPVEQVRRILLFAYQSELQSLTEAHRKRPNLPRAYYYRAGVLVTKLAAFARALRPRTEPEAPAMNDAPETIWIVREDDLAPEWYPTIETAKTWGTPVEYIRADIFHARIDAMMEEREAGLYDEERELLIAQLVTLLIRAREATDDHQLFSDIGELLPNLRPPPR